MSLYLKREGGGVYWFVDKGSVPSSHLGGDTSPRPGSGSGARGGESPTAALRLNQRQQGRAGEKSSEGRLLVFDPRIKRRTSCPQTGGTAAAEADWPAHSLPPQTSINAGRNF